MYISRQSIREEKSKENKSTAIRIKKTVLDDLKKEAEQKMEDVNTLISQMLRSHWIRNYLHHKNK
jgi:predicted HicB family RNase H-like nuclease